MSVTQIQRFAARRSARTRMESWMRIKDPAAIRRWRKQRHFSQRDLAFLVRRSQTTIFLIEKGELRTLSEDLAIAIAARLDVPWEDLFAAEESDSMHSMTTGMQSTSTQKGAA